MADWLGWLGQLLSKSASKIIVKHFENEKSITKTMKKKTVTLTFSIFDFHFHCFLHLKRAKMNPSGDPPDPVHGLPLGTSPTRAGGQDDVS